MERFPLSKTIHYEKASPREVHRISEWIEIGAVMHRCGTPYYKLGKQPFGSTGFRSG